MRNRLLLLFVGVVALVLLVHDVPLARHLREVEQDRLTTALERDAFTLAGRAEEALEAGTAREDADLQQLVTEYAATQNVRVVIVDVDAGVVSASRVSDVSEDYSNRPEIVSALSGRPSTGQRFSDTLSGNLFYVAVPVLSGDRVVGSVRLSAPARVVSDRIGDQERGLVLVALISLLIASAVAWWFATTVTRPIRRLQATTQTLASGDLTTRASDDDGPPEVRDLAVSFNAMAARLQQLVERQRAFAGTASHQLRTPLTALRLRLEQLASASEHDPTSSRYVDAAIEETDRLHRMIEGLLALSRAEQNAGSAGPVDLVAIVRDRVAHWEPLAAERGVTIEVGLPPDARSIAVGGAVEQIVDNLVDNALDVSPVDSTLRLVVNAAGDLYELHVIDAGPGLSLADREAAFERFWRGTRAAAGGSGLGLAIVRQLAEAGGGAARLADAQGGGLDAVVTFRAAPGRG